MSSTGDIYATKLGEPPAAEYLVTIFKVLQAGMRSYDGAGRMIDTLNYYNPVVLNNFMINTLNY